MTQKVPRLVRNILILFYCLLLSACFLLEDEGESLSGTIYPMADSAVDSDVNDPLASYAPNDSPATAQLIANPVTLGGYVNRKFAGNPKTENPLMGRSYESGDLKDFFKTSLLQDQVIILQVSNYSTANNLDLYLYNESGSSVVASSTSTTPTETIIVPGTGHYIIEVRVVSGYSSYVLSVGLSNDVSAGLGGDLDVNADFVPGEVIVRFKPDAAGNTLRSLAATTNPLGLTMLAGNPGRNSLYRLPDNSNEGDANKALRTTTNTGIKTSDVSGNEVLQRKYATIQAINELRRREDVQSAQPNYIYYPTAVPNDPDYDLQWHYPIINLPQAWDVTTGQSVEANNNVIVAVIDTGVLVNHPDLQGQLVAGYDFVVNHDPFQDNQKDGDGLDPDPDDPGDGVDGQPSSYHGTHVAGTIAAATNNNRNVAGVSWNAKIMPLRVLGALGGTEYDIEQAIRFAAGLENDSNTKPAKRADIINLSLGGPLSSGRDPQNVPEAFRLAREAGVIIVAAAGNDNTNTNYYPSAFSGVVGVAAVNGNKQRARYSNFGANIDIAAPGGEIDLAGNDPSGGVYSLSGEKVGGNLRYTTKYAVGTSMAAPHVAGVAALMKAVFPAMRPIDFDAFIQTGLITEDLGTPGRDNSYGYGLVDAFAAVSAASTGQAPELPPFAQISPTSLNFSLMLNSMNMNISNSGGGTLSVISIEAVSDDGNWLSVTPAGSLVDGLGRYIVNVERAAMNHSFGMHVAEIRVSLLYNGETQREIRVPVFAVTDSSLTDNAGTQYVVAQKVDGSFKRAVKASMNNGVYSFNISDLSSGRYWLQSGSDLDNDGDVSDAGEARGIYPSFDNPRVIILEEPQNGSNISAETAVFPLSRSGLNFETGFVSLRGVREQYIPDKNIIQVEEDLQ